MDRRGFALLPIISVLGIAIVVVAGYFAVHTLSSQSVTPLREQNVKATSTVAREASVTGTLDPHGIESTFFTVGAAPSVRVTVDTPLAGVIVRVTDPKGGNYSATAYTGNADSKEGERYIIVKNPDGTYRITIITPGGNSVGEYRVTVENPSGSASAPYIINIPDVPVVITDTQNTSGINNTTGVTISITVGETVTVQGFVAVTGAHVTANITTPSQQKISLVLIEDVGNPGTYSGVYTGATESGTYIVEYVILGENSAGDAFYKTSYDQFVVTGGTVGSLIKVNKKFDINRGNEIQLIGY